MFINPFSSWGPLASPCGDFQSHARELSSWAPAEMDWTD